MDSFELNKIIGAILGTLLFVMGVGFLAEAVYAPREAAAGYTLPEPEGSAHSAEAEAPAAPTPIGVLLASADAKAGETVAKKCQSCHNFAAGAGNKAGPELADVVGRVVGSHAGFAYSDIMKQHQAAGDTWTYELLNSFLLSPKAAMPNTKMGFSGLKNDKERADIIAYLASINPNAPPFPPADMAPPADAAATPAADGTAPVATESTTETPTTTSTETPVEGTPTTGTEPAATTTEPAPAAH